MIDMVMPAVVVLLVYSVALEEWDRWQRRLQYRRNVAALFMCLEQQAKVMAMAREDLTRAFAALLPAAQRFGEALRKLADCYPEIVEEDDE